jgi:hypothetical protein
MEDWSPRADRVWAAVFVAFGIAGLLRVIFFGA